MANLGKWSSTSLTTVMSTELNSVANNTLTQSGSSFDNTANLNLYADIEIFLNTLSPASGSYVGLFIAESVDGTNFPAQTLADFQLTPTQNLASVATGTVASSTQRIVIRHVLIPPAKFFVYFMNQTGVSLNAASNTVKFLTYSMNLNG